MRAGAAALGDQEIGGERHDLPAEKKSQTGRGAQQRQDRQQEHREQGIIAGPAIVAVEARQRDDQAAGKQQDGEQPAMPLVSLAATDRRSAPRTASRALYRGRKPIERLNDEPDDQRNEYPNRRPPRTLPAA